ncbi:MAG: 50S ribosomal protein L17 [Saprospiraceae bacterium]
MRHGKKVNHLGRKTAHRKALLRNLTIALIEHKRISTTLAKAKALRKTIEPIVTKAKTDSMHSRRTVFSALQNKEAIKELFDVIGPKVGARPGGYVRVIKTGFRKGDGAEMAMIEFVDFNDVYVVGKTEGEGSTGSRRRRRRGGKGGGAGAGAAVATTAAAAVVATEVVADEEE